MNTLRFFYRLCLSMAMILMSFIYAHAFMPIISDQSPKNVNLNQSATLLLVGHHLASPLTITIAEDVNIITNNSNPYRVTCPITARSTPGSVTFYVQNINDTWKNGTLNFKDCSSFVQIENIVRSTDYILTVSSLCYTGFTYQLDTFDEQDVELSKIYLSNLSEGSHQLTITGYDAAKNYSIEHVSFTVDSIPPEIQLHNIPKKITANTSATISVTTEDDATYYRYVLDQLNYDENVLSEPITLTSLPLGTHSLLVYGCDSHDNCQAASDVNPITWTILDIAFANDSALTTTTVLAGTQSGIYSTNCMENDVELEWSVFNYEGKPMGETVSGNSFSFTPPKTGAYAGTYSVKMTATHDNETVTTLNADIQVPFDIDAKRYNILDEGIISVQGVAPGANLVQDIKANEFTDPETDLSEIGYWHRVNTEAMQLTFKPSTILSEVVSFDVWISIENDLDLNEDNMLYEQTTGPFFIIPYKDYTITLTNENGATISTTTNTDITIREVVTLTNQNLTASKSDVRFSLPASGGTYFFKIEDNREPPVFMPQTIKTTECNPPPVTLQSVGQYVIEGSVQDKKNNYLENVIVTAFQPVDETDQSFIDTLPEQYEAKTENNGKYTIYLPELSEIGGWTVIAGKEGYISAIKTDQQANTEVSFNGINALQLETEIEAVWIENDRINIQADPYFKYPGEIDIKIITKDNEYYAQEHVLENKTISFAKPTSDEYTLILFVDTQDNNDPKTGNFSRHAYRKNSTQNVLARIDKTMNVFGGAVFLDHNNKKAKVEIPANGITESATITIEQIEKASECNATTGTQFIYGIHATSINTGHSLTKDQMNQIAITLPFNLRTIHPGDIENGAYHVYRADTLEMMENHETEVIYNIKQSDYLGDGKIGSVTVLVDKLSYFAIGIPPEIKASSEVQSLKNDEGGDCFIGILH